MILFRSGYRKGDGQHRYENGTHADSLRHIAVQIDSREQSGEDKQISGKLSNCTGARWFCQESGSRILPGHNDNHPNMYT